MALAKRFIGTLLVTSAAVLALAPSGAAQERVGVVTNVEGTATVARAALPEARALRFKDDVYLRDRITTGERSIVRVLLGGRATVTARERSVLTITEAPGVSTIELGAGRISVAVSKSLMKRGAVVEIRTPNVVTAIRGTVVVAEVSPAPSGYRSVITILRGLVEVTRLDATGQLVGPAVKVGALERVAVTGSNPVPTPETITRQAAERLASDFSFVPKNAPSASVQALNAKVKGNSVREAARVLDGGTTDAATGVTSLTGSTTSTLTGLTGSTTPIIAPTATSTLVTNPLGTVTSTTTTVIDSLLQDALR